MSLCNRYRQISSLGLKCYHHSFANSERYASYWQIQGRRSEIQKSLMSLHSTSVAEELGTSDNRATYGPVLPVEIAGQVPRTLREQQLVVSRCITSTAVSLISKQSYLSTCGEWHPTRTLTRLGHSAKSNVVFYNVSPFFRFALL